jgi:hypothetical protein
MSDDRLRRTERRWRETGAPEDGRVLLRELSRAGAPTARLLRARVEVGDLAPGRLQLAAFLGDPGAREALEAPLPRAAVESVTAFVAELGRWGPEPWPRVGLAVLRLLDRALGAGSPPGPWLGEVAGQVAALLERPDAVPVAEVIRVHDALGPEVAQRTRRLDVTRTDERARWLATQTAQQGAQLAAMLAERRDLELLRSPVRVSVGLAVNALTYADLAPRHAAVQEVGDAWEDAHRGAEARVRVAIREALLPWALS